MARLRALTPARLRGLTGPRLRALTLARLPARTAARPQTLWSSPVFLAVVLAIAGRVVLGLVGWLGTPEGWFKPSALPVLDAQIDHPGHPGAALIGPWQRQDALWYQFIATFGYGRHPAEAAFFPLYPGAVHVAGLLLGSYALAGILVSTAALIVALVLLHRLVAADLGEDVARRTVIYVACFPFAFFLFSAYTEALFLALSVGAVVAVRRRQHLVAGVLAALATSCRLQGMVLLLPLGYEVLVEVRRRRTLGWDQLACLLLPVIALILTLSYLGGKGGFETAEQLYWHVRLAFPWTVLGHSLDAIVSGTHPEEVANLLLGIGALVALPLMWRRLPRSYTLYTAGMVIPLWFRENGYSPMMSTGRFCTVVFPLFVLVAVLTPRRERLVIVASTLLLLELFFQHVRYTFVG